MARSALLRRRGTEWLGSAHLCPLLYVGTDDRHQPQRTRASLIRVKLRRISQQVAIYCKRNLGASQTLARVASINPQQHSVCTVLRLPPWNFQPCTNTRIHRSYFFTTAPQP